MKILVSVLAIVATLILFGTLSIEEFLIEFSELTWFQVYLTPRIVFLFCLLILAARITLWVNLKTRLKTLVFMGLVASGVSSYLLIHRPLKVDWNKYGTEVSEDPDVKPLELFFKKTNPNFKGIACLALTSCDYCHNMIDNLIIMKNRKPDLDIAIFIFSIDSSEIELVQSQIGDTEISIQNAPDPNVSFRITYGNFPTLLYVKQGQVTHRWYNNEFGHPAKDLVESGVF